MNMAFCASRPVSLVVQIRAVDDMMGVLVRPMGKALGCGFGFMFLILRDDVRPLV